MAGEPVVHIGENSPEHVAYQLFRHTATVEGKSFSAGDARSANREWILRTYYQCLVTVKGSGHIDNIISDFGVR